MTYCFETATSDTCPPTNQGCYAAITGYRLIIGPGTSGGEPAPGTITVYNNQPTDKYEVSIGLSGGETWFMHSNDPSSNAFSSDGLPVCASFPFSNLVNRDMMLTGSGPSGSWEVRGSVSGFSCGPCPDCNFNGIPDSAETGPPLCPEVGFQPDPNCSRVPPFTPNFNVVEKWHWPYTVSASGNPGGLYPNHTQVMTTPIVADLNHDGHPEIIFSSFIGTNQFTNGVLRVLDGATGLPPSWFTIPPTKVRGSASIAVGNIDSDPELEICAVEEVNDSIVCFKYNGVVKWHSSPAATDWIGRGAPAIAELDSNSPGAEIIAGNRILVGDGSLQGTVLWTNAAAYGVTAGPIGPISFAADINGGTGVEIIIGGAVYNTGTGLPLMSTGWNHRKGLSAVGNFDGDAFGELVVVDAGSISLYDDDGTLMWGPVTIPNSGGLGGPPTIGNFDADADPEIGVAGQTAYTVFDPLAPPAQQILWSSTQLPIPFDGSATTGSTLFDFEGDGKAEVVYNDERYLFIYNGSNGNIRFYTYNCNSTAYDMPVVADVDGDCRAEIVVCSSDSFNPADPIGCILSDGRASNGIRVFEDANDGWVNTRAIWNQHAYSITNVNDSGSIPAYITPNWISGASPPNTFRANNQGGPGCPPFAAPDLTVLGIFTSCQHGSFTIHAVIENVGATKVLKGVEVAFYKTYDPICCPGPQKWTAVTKQDLAPGDTEVVMLNLLSNDFWNGSVLVCVDDDGYGNGAELECDETNNCCCEEISCPCPLDEPGAGDPCYSHQADECSDSDPDHRCRPQCVEIMPGSPPFPMLKCACADPGPCGTISIEVNFEGYQVISCSGNCPTNVVPCQSCQVFDQATGMPLVAPVLASSIPVGTILCCDCFGVDDPLCEDGVFCNGVETCGADGECIPGDPPCSPAEFCDETQHTCPIPTVSAWGLVVLTLLLLIGAKIYFARHQTVTAS